MIYRREIDGLRALAVLPVMLFHAGFSGFSGGFVGVDVFFVISGYLITGILINEQANGTFTLTGFYERRARRILPALFVVLLACLPFAWAWLLPSDLKAFARSLAAAAISLSNILFWRESGYFDTSSELKPLLHTWSLGVEEQYYMVFPLLLLGLARWRPHWTPHVLWAGAALSLALAQWAALHQPSLAFYLLPTRGWELLAGALLAYYHSRPAPRIPHAAALNQAGSLLGLAMVAYAVLRFDQHTPFPGVYALLPTLGAVLMIACAQPGTWVGCLLATPLLVGIGLISYSAYLWHQPVLAFARYYLMTQPRPAVMAALLLLILGLAWLSWRYVERPFRHKNGVSRRHIFIASLVGCSGFFLLGLAGQLSQGFAWKFDATVKAIDHSKTQSQKREACWARLSRDRSFAHACELGDTRQTASFVLFGDSHAGTLVDVLHQQARAQGIHGLDYTFRSCIPVMGSQSTERDETSQTCQALRQAFFDPATLNALPPTVILAARWTLAMEQQRSNNGEGGQEPGTSFSLHSAQTATLGYQAALAQDYADSVQQLLRQGKTVILVYPIPEMSWDVPNRLARLYLRDGRLSVDSASTSLASFIQRNQRTYAALDRIGTHPQLIRIKPASLLCDTAVKGRCAAQLHGLPLYFDDDHLSDAGAIPVVNAIMTQLRQQPEASTTAP